MCLFPNISYMILHLYQKTQTNHPNTSKYPSKYWCFPLNPHLPTHSRSCSSYNEVMTPRRWATSARGGWRSHFCRATTGGRKRLEPNVKMQFSWSCMYFQYLYFSRCNYLACALLNHWCLWIFSWTFIDFIVVLPWLALPHLIPAVEISEVCHEISEILVPGRNTEWVPFS